MPIQEQLRNVLIIIADLTKNDSNADTYDFVIYERLNHIAQEKVDKYLNELSSLGLIAERIRPKTFGVDFRLFHITKEGLHELMPGA
jgi:hypothetical protein